MWKTIDLKESEFYHVYIAIIYKKRTGVRILTHSGCKIDKLIPI